MTWVAVARKDFRDAVRSRALWALSAVFLLMAGGISVAYATVDEISGGAPSAAGLVFFVAGVIGTFVSLAAILACYRAVAGERDSGTIKVLLSLPHSRADVVLGKLFGRTAVLALPVVGTLVLGVLLGGALMGDVDVLATLLLAVVALLFTLAYVGIMVGLSAAAATTTRAATYTIGFFVVVELFWDVVVFGIAFAANGFSFRGVTDFPAWLYPVTQVPPSSSFVTSLSAVIPDAPTAAGGAGGMSPAQIDAFFATPWVGVVALAVWAVAPVGLGYLRFQRADL